MATILRSQSRFLNRSFIVLTLAATLGAGGCSLIDDLEEQPDDDDEIVHCQAGRGTEMYFADAIRYNSSQQRWVFHNWKGSASGGGCEIHINVHDGQIALSQTVRQAITSASAGWNNAITAAGTNCEIFVHFESHGDEFATSSPRIDMQFVDLLAGGEIAGSTVVTSSPASRTFNHVRIQVAARFVRDADTLAIPASAYPALIAHEYGHAFGILGFDGATGHSSEPEDVMYPTAECAALSAGDIATMREVYARTPYYTPASSGSPASDDTRLIRVVCRY